MSGKVKIRLNKSRIGRSEAQRKVLEGLGLKKRESVVELEDTPSVRGMINKIGFMLDVEKIS